MSLSKILFSLAKSPIGDLIIGFAFGKASNILPVNKVLENDFVIAFWHPKPFWEKHILVVPKKQIKSFIDVSDIDKDYIFAMFSAVREIIQKLGWEKEGYSTLINGGERQEVHQLHMHLFKGPEL